MVRKDLEDVMLENKGRLQNYVYVQWFLTLDTHWNHYL